MTTFELVLVAIAIAVGLVGVVVPFLPGAFLVLGAILVWAVVEQSTTAWVAFGIAAVITVVAQVLKYAVPGRQLRAHGIPTLTLTWGAVLGVVGFFVVPVVGLPLGFVLGVYLAELKRRSDGVEAWRATVLALKAVGWSMLIEFAGALLAAVTWAVAVLVG